MKHTEMKSGALYRAENHLYCLKGDQYYWLPYDHFSQRYGPAWKRQTVYDLMHLELRLVTAADHTPGIRIHRDSTDRPIRIEILTFGSYAKQ